MESPRFTLLLILLLFIFFSPDQTSVHYSTQDDRDRLAVEKEQDFDALTHSKYGELPSKGLNLTGLRLEDGYQLQLLPVAQDLTRQQQVDSWYGFDRLAPVYHDINGEVRGDFRFVEVQKDPQRSLNLTELDPGTEFFHPRFDRNVTDQNGQLTIELKEKGTPSRYLPREVKASISIFSDSSPGNGWDARLAGVHFPSGAIVLTTSSRKWNALPALPHLTLNQEEFDRSRIIMNTSLTNIWNTIGQGAAADPSLEAAPKCELIVWMHQKPLLGSNVYIEEIEEELRNPDGAPIGQPPPMAFTALVFSPDCGYILRADTVFGPKAESYSDLVRHLTAAFALILVAQIVLLKRQMERCATPSTRSRVSYHTFVISAFSDGLTFFALIGLLAVDTSVFLLGGVAAFLCCIHVAFLEVKFIFDIWTVQVGDPANAERERQRRTAAANSNTPPTANSTTTETANAQPPSNTQTENNNPPAPPPPLSEAGLPLPATARTSPTPPPTIINLPTDPTITTTNDIVPPRTTFISLYSKFYFALLNLMFFTLWSSSWSPTPRHIYHSLLVFAFFSLWLPQIYRNTMRNCRKALTWEYVLGSSVLRAVPILYWFLDDRNVLYATTNPTTALVLGSWLVVQIVVLAVQQFSGPRIFVPDSWCPAAYDYHPVLYDDLEAGGLPIGEITSASEGKDADRKDGVVLAAGARKLFDCAICMNEIDVPVVSKDEKRQGGAVSVWMGG
ncbi:hypothetical protein LTR64_003223 [Lithohypha guttulata]|uniref:uncharacterized protein n=1 Tax=Lithohypha guttulata TaxID=1690604 RepID=UPI002DDFC663|nr:hypothetical protein LTR51_000555 [Lithohypha guttulata]